MAEKDKKPEIRFTGFTDAWEQRKLEDEALEMVAGGDIDKYKISTTGKYPVLANALTNDGIVGYYQDEFRIKAPAVTVTGRGDVGHAKARKDDFTPVVRLLSIKSNHDVDFLGNAINNHKVMVESTGVPQLTVPQLARYEIYFPKDIDEEKIIGAFLLKFDNLITLHQRKYDKLVIVKKSMLQKMFPKDGANVPEIRFKGFTGVWEQNKLNYYIETSNEKNVSNSFTKDDVLSVSGSFGIVNQIEFQGRSFAGVSVSNYGIVNIRDIVYTKSPLKANPYGIIKTNKGKAGIVSTLYAIYNPKEMTNSNFVQCYFESDYRLNRYLKPLVNKGAKNDMKVTDDNALSGLVIFPSYDEQTKIAGLFEHLDNLITHHQRELEKLKNIKKAMLEKMFV